MEAENQFGRVWGLGLECCPGVWLVRRGYQPLVATSQMLKIDFLKIHQLTWIIVRDELMCVLFASFSVGVLVLVPVGCLWIIPEGVLDLDSYAK